MMIRTGGILTGPRPPQLGAIRRRGTIESMRGGERGAIVPFKFAGPAGPLEALWKEPPVPPRGAAVVAHPHPLYGGTMNNKVVFRICRALSEAGYSVLRFNFRGVGASAGAYDRGRGEADDFRAALDEAQRRNGIRIVAAGFSFGSVVALAVGAADPRVPWLIGAGVPRAIGEIDFRAPSEKPAFFISGSQDAYGPPEEIRPLLSSRFPKGAFSVIEDADHFFTGYEDLLERKIAEFAKTHRETTAAAV
jgi:uncharacterized protein